MDQADHLRVLSSQGSQTKVIAITSGKGGVGKTNVSINLAVHFAKRGLKVLLIDADLGLANTNILLGCSVGKSMEDVLFNNAALESVFIRTRFGFDLLPGSSGVRTLLAMDAFTQRALFDQLFLAMRPYDIVIYDTAPGISDHVLCFNASAHEVVVVTHPEPTALTDAYALIKILALEKKEKRFRLLVNRAQSYDDALKAFRRISEVTQEFLNISVDFLGALPDDAALTKAVRRQIPVCVDAPQSPFTIALNRVGDKLLASNSARWNASLWENNKMQGALR